jgi:hypothetical protein
LCNRRHFDAGVIRIGEVASRVERIHSIQRMQNLIDVGE